MSRTTPSPSPAPDPAPSRPSVGVVSLALTLMLGLQPVTTDLYLPALPGVREDLAAPMEGLQLTLSALILCFGMAQLVWGPVSDRYGRRPVLLISLTLYVVASLACALAPDITTLVAFRAAQGAMLAAVVMVGRAMVRDLYEPIEGAQVMSRGMTGLGVIAIASMPLGGALAGLWGWRSNLLAVGAVGLVTLLFIASRLPETLVQRNPRALSPAPLLRTMGKTLAHPTFWAWAMLVTCTYSGLFVLLATSSFVFITTLGLTPAAFGAALGSNSLAYLLGTVVCRRWIARRGLGATVRLGGSLSLLSAALLLLVALAEEWALSAHPILSGLSMLSAGQSPWPLMAALWLYALGHGIHQPCGHTGAVAPFPQHAGTASALAGFIMSMTAFAIGLVLGSAFDGSVRFMATGIALGGLATGLMAWTLVQRHGVPRVTSSGSP